MDESGGTLSVVATPIGNLADMTFRAVETLKTADVILCEDTRVTKKLLDHYQITTPTKRYDAHTSSARHEAVLNLLREGKHVALVSDAGTPAVSDPGVMIIGMVREELPSVRIETVPGPSALTAAYAIAGISGNQFIFLGFVPHKKGRQTFFKNIAQSTIPVIFYESPHRIVKTLESLCEALASDRRVVIARELTKMYEEVLQGSAQELLGLLKANSDRTKGEFVVLVEGEG